MAYRDRNRVNAALRAVASKGVDPYNSHTSQAVVWERKQRDYVRRRSEFWANKELQK